MTRALGILHMAISGAITLLFAIGSVLGGYGLWVLLTDTPDPPSALGTQAPGSRSNAPSRSS